MSAVKFYHLVRHPLEDAARALLRGALAHDWRVMVRGADVGALEGLDRALWLRPDDDFLPHGMEGGPHDADQPILLGRGGRANGAGALMLIGGVAVDLDEARGLDRLWVLFEGADAAQVEAARQEWRRVRDGGMVAEYWSDASGKWECKATSGDGTKDSDAVSEGDSGETARGEGATS